jgi:predicted transcriptional regulator
MKHFSCIIIHVKRRRNESMDDGRWTFLSNHAHVLVCLARDPDARMREVAARVGITERAVQRIIGQLESLGVIAKIREGRRNHYEIDFGISLLERPHRTAPHRTAPHRTAPHRTAPHRTGLYGRGSSPMRPLSIAGARSQGVAVGVRIRGSGRASVRLSTYASRRVCS